jgi:hypothetical protein
MAFGMLSLKINAIIGLNVFYAPHKMRIAFEYLTA